MASGDPSIETDEILRRELGKLGAASAEIGSTIAGGDTERAADGARRGVDWAMRHVADEVYEASVDFPGEPAETVKRCYDTLSRLGRLTDSDKELDHPRLQAVIRSGFARLNPAVVQIDVQPTAGDTSHVTVRATAKEGLIRQRTAEKAVTRVVSALQA